MRDSACKCSKKHELKNQAQPGPCHCSSYYLFRILNKTTHTHYFAADNIDFTFDW